MEQVKPAFQLRALDNNPAGRLALVTGASGGIGSACARALANEGCDVALHFCSNHVAVQGLAEELRTRHASQTFTIHQADLSERNSTHNLIDSVISAHSAIHHSLSILVLNAGLSRRIRDVNKIEWGDWDDVMEVNANSQFILIKDCLDERHGRMRTAKWGRIVLIGSIASKGGGINGCHYAASKGALTSMGLNLARILIPDNITVNIVSPGMIGGTGMIPSPKSETLQATGGSKTNDPGLQIASTIPLGRLGDPSEVANVMIMFVKTGYMTGEDVVLGGGLN